MKLAPDSGDIVAGTTIDVTIVANTTPESEDEQSEPIKFDYATGPVDVEVRLETSPHLEGLLFLRRSAR